MILVEEKWEQASWTVEKETVGRANPDGSPKLNEQGEIELVERTVLILIHQEPTGARVIKFPFDDGAKAELIRRLTGGVIVAPNGAPPHLPFGKGV